MQSIRNILISAMVVCAGTLGASAVWANDFEESVPVEPGGSLLIELPVGSIDVETHSENRVEIDANLASWMDIEVTHEGSDVRVSGHVRGWLGFLQFGRIRVRARVPERFDVDLHTNGGHIDVQELIGTVYARTTGGTIEVQEIRGNVEAETSGGHIEAKEIEGDLLGHTTGGNIRISEVSGKIDARTMGGGIRVSQAMGVVLARTTGGSIEVEFEHVAAGEIETTGGSIEIQLPEDSGVHLRAWTTGGQVVIDDEFEIDGRVDRDRVDADLNGGGEKLELRTTGGSVRVETR